MGEGDSVLSIFLPIPPPFLLLPLPLSPLPAPAGEGKLTRAAAALFIPTPSLCSCLQLSRPARFELFCLLSLPPSFSNSLKQSCFATFSVLVYFCYCSRSIFTSTNARNLCIAGVPTCLLLSFTLLAQFLFFSCLGNLSWPYFLTGFRLWRQSLMTSFNLVSVWS